MDEHIPETELALFAFDPDSLPPQRQVTIQRHVSACTECQLSLDFFAVTEDDLSDPDVWEPIVGSATLDSLRAYAEQIAAEDEDAEVLLKSLLRSPAAAAMTNIQFLGRRYITGGVVRRLNAHAHNVCESEPLDALTFADMAVTVAGALPDETYPAAAVYELRGTAWKERARALHLLGRLSEALDSLDRAEHAYRHLPFSGFALADTAHVRAAVLYEQQRPEDAERVAATAETAFAHLGDDGRRMRSMYLRACIKYEAQDISGAMSLFSEVLRYGEAADDARWIARGAYALGNCEIERSNLGAASIQFQKALVIFREIGPVIDRLNTEWGIGRVLINAGNRMEGMRRLREIAAEFEKRGMVTDMALVGLDTADALLALGLHDRIVDLATRLFRVFTDAGMLTGALTAIAYVKEAAAAGTLTPSTLRVVRTFLRRAERQPELVFTPPPDTFR